MPPSPSLRYSPGRELRGEKHNRGRSFEGRLLFKEKDDDLTLFNEMQTRESENSLLQSSDDFEDIFSIKLKHFSDNKLGISIPVRGESSELLNANGDKNDYEWLLTPPETPLFPSLDDEPPVVNATSRGRTRSKPISISRSSTMEKSYQSSRGSASPNRFSPSPQSGSSQLMGRPSSAPYSGPPASQLPATPTRRSSPPSKHSSSAPRSSTPTPRRMSTGSSTAVPSGVRGTSPAKTSRGNSTSPKVKTWQSNIPGFSLDAPPNLRTSLTDRPASFVRGSSPASKNGRQSMSPTASRSASSSHSHDRDLFSSHSKGSVISSGDDDIGSLQSVPRGSSEHSISKRVGASPNNRVAALSKKSSRIATTSSSPKRPFDSAMRQMDHKKTPQHMFRPLLSSVPNTTFYAGKGVSSNHSVISSVTTGNNARSDQGLNAPRDTKGSHCNQDDLASECKKVLYPDGIQEVFAFDNDVDLFSEEAGHDRYQESLDIRLPQFDQDNVLCAKGHTSEVSSLENIKVCSKCGSRYHVDEKIEGDIQLCAVCRKQYDIFLETVPAESYPGPQVNYKSCDVIESSYPVLESLPEVIDEVERRVMPREENVERQQTSCCEQSHSEDKLNVAHNSLPNKHTEGQHLRKSSKHLGSSVDSLEVAGISVLLQRSNSSKGPVVQGRTFVATTRPYDNFANVRDKVNSLRSSIGYSSASASSSVDFSSGRNTDTRVQRQLSGKKSDIDLNSNPQNNSLSGACHDHQVLALAAGTHEESSEVHGSNMKCDAGEESSLSYQMKLSLENKEADHCNLPFTGAALQENIVESSECQRSINHSTFELSSSPVSNQLDVYSDSDRWNHETDVSYENGKDSLNRASVSGVEVSSSVTPESSLEEEQTKTTHGVDVMEVHGHCSLATISEVETGKCRQEIPGLHEQSPESMIKHEFQEPYFLDHTLDISEESTVTVDCHGGNKGKSLTLEEATDAILFCRSIVHDLAYKAATIAIEKETEVLSVKESWPTVTILGKSISDRKYIHNRASRKRTSKPVKYTQRQREKDAELPPTKTENDENVDEQMMRNVGLPNNKMNSMEPPKLESKCNCSIM